MRRRRFSKPLPLAAGLVALMLAVAAVPLGAQPASVAHAGHGFGPVYDAAHEITLNGTVRSVVTQHAKGSPAGMHLLVAGPQGIVDAHVGSLLSKVTKESLREGAAVKIVGAMTTMHGKDYLLARTLTIGERTVTVRSERGAPVPEHEGRAHSIVRKPTQTAANGGAR
jgi:hypothetical protein